MKDVAEITCQYIFVEAASETDARAAANAAMVLNPWAISWRVDSDSVLNDPEGMLWVAKVCADAQLKHLATFARNAHPEDLFTLAEDHNAMLTWDDGGLQIMCLGHMADIIAGVWTPHSGGYDAVAELASFAFLVDRLNRDPARQWAVPMIIDSSS